MPDERQAQIAQLETEIAALQKAIDALSALPDAQRLLKEQLAAKQRALATLRGDEPSASRSHTQTIGDSAQVGTAVAGDVHGNITSVQQSGGINFGSGNTIGSVGDVVAGDKVSSDKVSGDKIVNHGPQIYGNVTSGRDTNIATNQTISNAETNQGAQGVFHAPVTINYGGAPAPGGAAARALTPDEQIAQYHERLAAQRGQLNDLLLQIGKLGSAWAPPAVIGGIREARASIRRTKQALRSLGATVHDHPDDEDV